MYCDLASMMGMEDKGCEGAKKFEVLWKEEELCTATAIYIAL